MRSRTFSWDDVPALHALISRDWRAHGPRARMHIGDLSWNLRPLPNTEPTRDWHVWPDERGGITAFAWFEEWSWGGWVAGDEAPSDDEILDWLEAEELRQRPLDRARTPFMIGALEDDGARTGLLRGRGYAPTDHGSIRFWLSLEDASFAAAPPSGFAVRSIDGEDDIARRVFVQTTSFERSSATVEVWRALMRLPGYRRELDLICVAPDGTGAAACTCWYDEANRCGEFEPVGTSKAYQRMGLGKAVIAEGLRRLQALGATQAIVQTNRTNAAAIALYRSCGFAQVATDVVWSKAL